MNKIKFLLSGCLINTINSNIFEFLLTTIFSKPSSHNPEDSFYNPEDSLDDENTIISKKIKKNIGDCINKINNNIELNKSEIINYIKNITKKKNSALFISEINEYTKFIDILLKEKEIDLKLLLDNMNQFIEIKNINQLTEITKNKNKIYHFNSKILKSLSVIYEDNNQLNKKYDELHSDLLSIDVEVSYLINKSIYNNHKLFSIKKNKDNTYVFCPFKEELKKEQL